MAEPERGLVDEPVSWHVEGASTGLPLRLRLTTTDAAGRRWRSEGTYPIRADGTLAVGDGDFPFSSMEPDDGDAPSVTFTNPIPGWTVTAEAFGYGFSAQTRAERLCLRDVDRHSRSGDGWRLQVYVPRGASAPLPGVLVVGGSTGAAAVAPRAALLASHGYAAAVLAYMQEPGLPPAMDRIPVEVLGRALAEFPEADPHRIAVWAQSVGVGLALSALAEPDAPPVRAVVAVAPTDVVWQALGAGGVPPRHAALARGGRELPWLPMHGERLLGQVVKHAVLRRLSGPRYSGALRLHDMYARSRRDVGAVARSTIPVERIHAPMLVVAGDADAMWPSVEMAERIALRRGTRAGVAEDDELLVLPGAGHFCGLPGTPATVDRNLGLISGGTPEGNASGQRATWQAAQRFLAGALS